MNRTNLEPTEPATNLRGILRRRTSRAPVLSATLLGAALLTSACDTSDASGDVAGRTESDGNLTDGSKPGNGAPSTDSVRDNGSSSTADETTTDTAAGTPTTSDDAATDETNAATDSALKDAGSTAADGEDRPDGSLGASPACSDDPACEPTNDTPSSTPAGLVGCESIVQPLDLDDVVLSFVLDVSGSMGSGMQSHYSQELKWDPVVAATRAFFEDPESAGLFATLTFFPDESATLQGGGGGGFLGGMMADGGAAPFCRAESYSEPDVGLTALPSQSFGTALTEATPETVDDWGNGTPTLAAIEGTLLAIDAMREVKPNRVHAIVLITDGMPELCYGLFDDPVEIGLVVEAVAEVADDVPTHVIGVRNPATVDDPNPPDTVPQLQQVAEAGGTGNMHLLDTDDPEQTAADLLGVINDIRENSQVCRVSLAAVPAGVALTSDDIHVSLNGNDGESIWYDYDPECSGGTGWHFDDEAAPTAIQLCPAVCYELHVGSQSADLSVSYGCE